MNQQKRQGKRVTELQRCLWQAGEVLAMRHGNSSKEVKETNPCMKEEAGMAAAGTHPRNHVSQFWVPGEPCTCQLKSKVVAGVVVVAVVVGGGWWVVWGWCGVVE